MCTPFNLGAGKGYSVLDMVKAFEQASGRAVPYKVQPRRVGDVAENYSDPVKAEKLLGWKASNDLNAMCVDTWRWQSTNPQGYR
jgi:UDP-glucose 4-epimerase